MMFARSMASSLACFGLAMAAATAAARADPVTYAGRIANLDIVVEFTGDPANATAPFAGRYFYRAKGADIPLDAGSVKAGVIMLSEEGACVENACSDGKAPPVAATWTLSTKDEGKTLKGTWEGTKKLAIELSRIASRPKPAEYDSTPYGLFDFSDGTFLDETPITMDVSPYDFLRLDVAPVEGPRKGWPDASYRMVSDPRTKFEMPRIIDVAGGQSVGRQTSFSRSSNGG